VLSRGESVVIKKEKEEVVASAVGIATLALGG
jgi:hypothetical protein